MFNKRQQSRTVSSYLYPSGQLTILSNVLDLNRMVWWTIKSFTHSRLIPSPAHQWTSTRWRWSQFGMARYGLVWTEIVNSGFRFVWQITLTKLACRPTSDWQQRNSSMASITKYHCRSCLTYGSKRSSNAVLYCKNNCSYTECKRSLPKWPWHWPHPLWIHEKV